MSWSLSWASKRQTIIITLIALVVVLIVAAISVLVIYKAPTCFDMKQNGTETGVDCGGTCTRLCTDTVAPPSVRFARAIRTAGGRTDLVAYIDNPNPGAAAKGAVYTIELYGTDRAPIDTVTGTVDLPPKSSTPMFIPGIYTGSRTVAQAFLSFDAPSVVWQKYTDTRVIPTVLGTQLTDGAAPRIVATLSNPSARLLTDVKVIVTVFDAAGNAIAASQTLVASIPAQGTATAVVTWPESFSTTPARIEVIPVIPLPNAL